MNQVLNKVRDVDPNNSDAVKEALSSFFQNLSKHSDVEYYRWLRALESVITRFPKYCMSHRNTIETFLTKFLDSYNSQYVIGAAKCAHALQQVRPTQEKSATPKTSWRDQMRSLCEAAHRLISALFPHAVDIYKHGDDPQKENQSSSPLSSALGNITKVSTKTNMNESNKQMLNTRLRNVFVFIQAMLVEMYPVAKPIRPQTALDVILRALSVSSGTNTGSAPTDVLMVKTQALRSLDALVACLGSNLIPFSPLVFRCIIQTLKWTTDNPSEESRKVRITAYSSLTAWLTALRCHREVVSRGHSWEDDLTSAIIDDVTPHKHVVQLTMNTHSTKHLSKKAKRKMANTMLQESSIASHMPGEKNKIHISEQTNDEVAIAALECAETLLTVSGIFLKPVTHKRFQERLVRECYNLHLYSTLRGLALLRALEASRKAAPPTVPPPSQYCLHLYSQPHCSSEISKFCTQALLDIRLHLHCSPPSLSFAITPPETKETEDKKKTVSERNRAALEALLGADKMPSQINGEIITITDEPANKKPRLSEEVSDKISVSSESVNSVDSDDSDEEDIKVVIEEDREGDTENVEIEQDNESHDTENYEIEQENTKIDEIDGNEAEVTIPSSIKRNMHTDLLKYTEKDTDEIEADSTQPEKESIYEAKTQIPVYTSIEDHDEQSPVSMEVTYDYPNTGEEKVSVLEKLDNENLPSTDETDDIPCGQVVTYLEGDFDKKSTNVEQKVSEDTPKVNGVDKSPENGVNENLGDKKSSITEKVNSVEVTVEEMMADFVDEVNEDA